MTPRDLSLLIIGGALATIVATSLSFVTAWSVSWLVVSGLTILAAIGQYVWRGLQLRAQRRRAKR